MTNALLRKIGFKLPIIQAPMAGVQGSALTIAVCKAGGLGSLPCAMLDTDAMRTELCAIRAATNQPYNVNFFCHSPPRYAEEEERQWRELLTPYYKEFELPLDHISQRISRTPFSEEAAELLEEFKPPVVSFHFGLPDADLLKRVKRLGAFILSTATTLEEAQWLQIHGADAVIAQGIEAGGHRGNFIANGMTDQAPTDALLSKICNKISLPVIASGGICSSRIVERLLSSGASAVQVGTAYLLCTEATTSEVHRSALRNPGPRATALTNLFSGRPARGLENRLIRELGPMNKLAPSFPLAAAALAPLRKKAESMGSADFSPLWCGENDEVLKQIPAATLTRELAGLYAGSTR